MSKRSVWKRFPKLEEKLKTLLNEGVFKKGGYDGLLSNLSEEDGADDISLSSLRAKVGLVVWRSGEDAPRNRRKLNPFKTRAHVTDEEIERTFPNLPIDFVRSRLEKESVGEVESGAERAHLLVGDPSELAKSLDLPAANMENPFLVDVSDANNPKLDIMNAIQIGLIYPEDIERNVARNKVRMAEAKGVDVILVTDNILHMDTKKASKNKPIRAQLSGMHVKENILVKSGWAYDSEEEIREFLNNDDVIFIPPEIRFKTLMDGLVKIFYEEDEETPIFSGQVIVQLGLNENEIASQAANDELRTRVQLVRNGIQSQIRSLEKELKEIDDPVEREIIESEIDVLAKRKKIATMSLANDEFLKSKWKKIHAWMIEHIEGNEAEGIKPAIPNSKVIGIGKVVFRLGENGPVIESRTVGHTRTSDTAHDYAMQDANRRSIEGELPDAILVNGSTTICGHTSWVRTMKRGGDEDYTPVIQTPVLLDRDFLKKQANNLVQGNEPIQRFLRKESLYTGSIDIHFHRVGNEWLYAFQHTDSRVFADPSNFTADRLDLLRDPEAPTIMYTVGQGDTHEGHQSNVLYECDDDPIGLLRHDEAFIRMMNKCNVPVFMYSEMGDILDGRHHENQNPPYHHEFMGQQEFREWLIKAVEGGIDRRTIAKAAYKNAIRGREVRPEDQMKNYLDRFIRNPEFLRFLVGIISRAEEYGVFATGEISLISLLPGNHMGKTWKWEFTETMHIVRELVNNLVIYCIENGIDISRKTIEKYVTDVTVGEHGSGYGALGIMRRGSSCEDKSLLYSFDLRHSPEKGAAKYGNTTRKAATDRDRRGAHKPYIQGLTVISRRAHTHMGGETVTNFGFILATGCQNDGDAFGEMLAYSLPHVSSDILGVPVEGPGTGSFVTMSVTKPVLREWLKNQNSINPAAIFRNALGWNVKKKD